MLTVGEVTLRLWLLYVALGLSGCALARLASQGKLDVKWGSRINFFKDEEEPTRIDDTLESTRNIRDVTCR